MARERFDVERTSSSTTTSPVKASAGEPNPPLRAPSDTRTPGTPPESTTTTPRFSHPCGRSPPAVRRNAIGPCGGGLVTGFGGGSVIAGGSTGVGAGGATGGGDGGGA